MSTDPWAPVPAEDSSPLADLFTGDSREDTPEEGLIAHVQSGHSPIPVQDVNTDVVGDVADGEALASLFGDGSEVTQKSPKDDRTVPPRSYGAVDEAGISQSEAARPDMTGLGKMNEATSSRRYSDADRLWPIVDQVMTVASSDVRIQQKAGQLELTRDAQAESEQREDLYRALKPLLASHGLRIPDPSDIPPVLGMAYDELVGISVLGELWRDDSITEILVDRWDRITIERGGKLELTPVRFRDASHAAAVARSLALRVSERQVSRSINLVTAELPRARVQFAYGPVVRGGLAIAIRKFSELLGLEALRNKGALNEEMESFLRSAVQSRAGVLVSGGTGTGKTTIINLLSSFIPDTERVVTIEDAFELSLANTHVVSLQTKEASSADDTVSVSLSNLLRATLRLRPDRIIVGEIREGEGAEVMLAAANTGHDGTMTTVHANSADMAVNERIVDLVRQNRASTDDAIRRTIASAFDLVLQVDRGRKGNRFISAIAQVDRNLIVDGSIVPLPLFIGEDDGNGGTRFRAAGLVRPDTALGRRLTDAGHSNWVGE